jgi:hypothetical protein
MLLALALYASTAHAGIPAGFDGTHSALSENTPHYALELLGREGSHGPRREPPLGPRVTLRRCGAGVKGQVAGGEDRRRARKRPRGIRTRLERLGDVMIAPQVGSAGPSDVVRLDRVDRLGYEIRRLTCHRTMKSWT